MDLEPKLRALAERAEATCEKLKTEAATSAALVMPFFGALGYDVFNPLEVVPEFTADVGIKKGEKVDYAIFQNEQPVILCEVKCWNVNLDEAHMSQLYRYFSVTPARVGILTNGLVYRFFADLDEANKMDGKPFLEFNLLDFNSKAIEQISQFRKGTFDPDSVASSASELKYLSGIRRLLANELSEPSDDFVRMIAKQVYPSIVTAKVVEQFRGLVKQSFNQMINDRVSQRLHTALRSEEERSTVSEEKDEPLPEGVVFRDGEIETTVEEVEGFNIVKAIVAEVIDPERVVMRDTKSYCGVLIDNNNRKPICRLHFNRSQKYLGVFDAEKNESRHPIDSLRDIYKHSAELKTSTVRYIGDEA